MDESIKIATEVTFDLGNYSYKANIWAEGGTVRGLDSIEITEAY